MSEAEWSSFERHLLRLQSCAFLLNMASSNDKFGLKERQLRINGECRFSHLGTKSLSAPAVCRYLSPLSFVVVSAVFHNCRSKSNKY
jgi:hypothetical protein